MNITLTNKNLGKEINGFTQLRVISVRHITSDAVMISFEVPKEMRSLFSFQPGQHVELLLFEEDQELRRAYSICSGKNEPLSIAVKALPNGRMSKYLNKHIKEGDIIAVSEPRGSFILNEQARQVVLIGAGSGITPLLSMLKTTVEKSVPVTLIYGNRTESSIMFRDEIAELISAKVIQFLSGEKKEGFGTGRINKENITALIWKDVAILNADAFYLCGPQSMIADVSEALQTCGVPADKIYFEYFSAPVVGETSELSEVSTFQGKCRVQAKLEGDKFQFEVSSDGPVLLEAARKAGIDAPFSCKTGVCGSCRAKVSNGSAIMKANYALSNEDIADGYILTCQAHPNIEKISISFDD